MPKVELTIHELVGYIEHADQIGACMLATFDRGSTRWVVLPQERPEGDDPKKHWVRAWRLNDRGHERAETMSVRAIAHLEPWDHLHIGMFMAGGLDVYYQEFAERMPKPAAQYRKEHAADPSDGPG